VKGEIGRIYICDSCGKQTFGRGIAGEFLIDAEGTHTWFTKFETPCGWSLWKGRDLCPVCRPDRPPIRLWARLGVDLFLTEEQYDAIINADVDYDVAEKTFINVIKAGLFEPCGDSYIPSEDGGIDIGNFNI